MGAALTVTMKKKWEIPLMLQETQGSFFLLDRFRKWQKNRKMRKIFELVVAPPGCIRLGNYEA